MLLLPSPCECCFFLPWPCECCHCTWHPAPSVSFRFWQPSSYSRNGGFQGGWGQETGLPVPRSLLQGWGHLPLQQDRTATHAPGPVRHVRLHGTVTPAHLYANVWCEPQCEAVWHDCVILHAWCDCVIRRYVCICEASRLVVWRVNSLFELLPLE